MKVMKTKEQKTSMRQMPAQFVFHHDGGHGWLEVPASTVTLLNLQGKISGFSYQHNEKIYLEEDLDLFVFAKAYLLRVGRAPDDFRYFNSLLTEVYDGDYSPIRNYTHYENKR